MHYKKFMSKENLNTFCNFMVWNKLITYVMWIFCFMEIGVCLELKLCKKKQTIFNSVNDPNWYTTTDQTIIIYILYYKT